MSVTKLIFLAVLALFSTMSVAEQSSLVEKKNKPFLSPVERYQHELMNLLIIVDAYCSTIYPKPTLAECIDKVKHGVGNSFDPHSAYLNKFELQSMIEENEGEFGGVGIEFKKSRDSFAPIVVADVPEGPGKRAGIFPGDVVTRITLGGTVFPAVSLSFEEAVRLVRGEVGSSVSITIMRANETEPREFTLIRERIKVTQITGRLLHENGKIYALITNLEFKKGNSTEMKQMFEALNRQAGGKLSGLILNLENNSGGLLYEAHNGIDLFLDVSNAILIRSNEGVRMYVPHHENLIATLGDITQGLPILVVVNGACASACEILSASLKHFGRAVIAGTASTLGKGIVQSVFGTEAFGVDDGGGLSITTAEYLIGSPKDWIPVQCVGVKPDIVFEYPGLITDPFPKECDQVGHVKSNGVMPNAPLHLPIKEANPKLYKAAEAMLRVFIKYQTPILTEEVLKRKQEEQKEK